MNAIAIVEFHAPIIHQWVNAPPDTSYLRAKHHHFARVRVEVELEHHDRDVEFHALRDFCQSRFPTGDVEQRSCESLAHELAVQVGLQFGHWRHVAVEVWEDEFVGARVETEGDAR